MPSLYPHEVRKIAQGTGAASGFAGFFFPSLRARGLGEEKPVPSYSAIVYKEGDEVRAEDRKGRKIASGASGVDDASVIQSAIDEIQSLGGGIIRIARGEYIIKQEIGIYAGVHILGEGESVTKLINQNSNFVFHKAADGSIHADEPLSVGSLTIEGDATNHGIKIEDQYLPILENIRFKNIAKAISLSSVQKWTEGSYIANVHGDVKEVGIEFVEEGGTGSFQDTTLQNIAFNLAADNARGIDISTDAELFNSVFLQVRFWAYNNNNYGIYIDGGIYRSLILTTFENTGGGTNCYGIVHGVNCKPFYLLISEVVPVRETDYSEDNRVMRIAGDELTIGKSSDGRAHLTLNSEGGINSVLEIKAEKLPYIKASSVYDRNLHIVHSRKGVTICLDSDNDETGEYFEIRKNGGFSWTGTRLFIVDENGRIKGLIFQFPTSAPSSPQAGDAYFDTSTGTLYIHDGTTWKSVTLT